MKSKTKITTLTLLLVAAFTFSQSNNEKDNRRIHNKAEKAEKTVEETNEQIDSAVASIDNTIEGAKETATKVGDIFFGKKDKKKISKNTVVITIASVSYDDKDVNQLYHEISKSKGAKNIIKTYSNGQMIIQMESKSSADAIWQNVLQTTRTSFNIDKISEKSIVLKLKK
ncbi:MULTISPECIES: hypothetical protein [Flavobacteriaceae]|jgi:hypothetical protein|uniref:Uncharacterized protein n=1 Tax=Croceitalea marina TaxID=1775166 RepID=A0ABW5N3W1_9FLAO